MINSKQNKPQTTETDHNNIFRNITTLCARIIPGLAEKIRGQDTIDHFKGTEQTKANEAFGKLYSKIKALDTTSGVVSREDWEDLFKEIDILNQEILTNSDVNVKILQQFNANILRACLMQKILEETKTADENKKEELSKILKKNMEGFNARNQELHNENANHHFFRILTMVLLGGALDGLDIISNIFDNFGGDFAQGVGETLRDGGVMGPFADINRAFGLDKIFEGLSRIPILNDVNQFVVDLAGSDYVSPFTNLAGGFLHTQGAQALFGAILLGNRFYHESSLSEKYKELKQHNQDFFQKAEIDLKKEIEQYQENSSKIITQNLAQLNLDICTISAYLKNLSEKDSQLTIPESFKNIPLNQDTENLQDSQNPKNLYDLIQQVRSDQQPQKQDHEEDRDRKLTKILQALGTNRSAVEIIKKEANQWKGDNSLNDDDNTKRKDALHHEYKELLNSMQVDEQERNNILKTPNGAEKDFEAIEKSIKEKYVNQNQDKVLVNIKTRLGPDIPGTSPECASASPAQSSGIVSGK